ncbi:MAG: hypothetical protein EHM42_06545 [Planctomycetaceae bacterium]|nr:MAG: hypothetical protein EHM42_06545 [Planctomycetaceae bacterium]
MATQGKQEQLRLGFLTAIDLPEKGFSGGLLVTNHYGRPLEFQCTTPVRPNSTQEILYGTSLAGFLLGELIGGTLVDKASVKPQLILTDREEILELRNHIDLPVALIERHPGSGETTLKLGRQTIRFHAAHTSDSSAVSVDTKQVPADADLEEPFARVREALQESLKSGALR